jgi:DNA-binding HxlR family transcriptional regulator
MVALSLIARPLCVPVLGAHLERPLRFPELCEQIPAAGEASLRGEVKRLRTAGALERRALGGMPYGVENELTRAGRELREVAETVSVWLSSRPHGPVSLASDDARVTIKALIAAWEAGVLPALAAAPRSLSELGSLSPRVSYPSLERRLSAMRRAHLVEALPVQHGHRPSTLTAWGRKALEPMATACHWDKTHPASGNTSGT